MRSLTALSDWLGDTETSDAQFGRTIGCDRGSVGRYQRGERYPDPVTLVRIRLATGGVVTADDMLATWYAKNPGKAPVVDDWDRLAEETASAAVAA